MTEAPDPAVFPYNLFVLKGILQTKLYVPPLRADLVPRQRLIKRLNRGQQLGLRLSLISAPAGFGKTTLVSEWVAQNKRPAAWLSLDEGDSEPTRFWVYLTAALQTISPAIGEGVVATLQSPQPPPVESVVTALLNDVAAEADRFILVLDDYHLIDSLAINDALTFLVERLPPQMHLVISSREDPNMPLPRLRVRGQLVELRAADLRFTVEEAADFLNRTMGLTLSIEEVAALEKRTEGWIAGLQLAALSMQGLDDVAAFIDTFTGSHRLVLDYLIEEVLEQQSKEELEFLLKTSLLEKLSGSLCDALTGREDGQQQLERLEQANLFVIPLDNERLWYRYHHLFADLLRQKLVQSHGDNLARLHQRASDWYQQANLWQEAIQHAIAAGDHERTATLAERSWTDWSAPSQMLTWLKWVRTLPDDIVRQRPVLGVAYAQALLNAGELEAADRRLRNVEELLARPDSNMIIVDEAQFDMLPALLATWRAYHARAAGDTPGAIHYAEQALELYPEDEFINRSGLMGLLALSYWANGDLKEAYRVFSKDVLLNDQDRITGSFVLADMKRDMGQLREAFRLIEQGLKLAEAQEPPMPQGTEITYSYFGELFWERGDLEQALLTLASAKALGDKVEMPVWQQYWFITKAHVEGSLGNLEAALDLLGRASGQFMRTPVPIVRPVGAMQARLWIRQGRLEQALQWTAEQELTTGDAVSYMRLYEHITLARLLLAQYRAEEETKIAGRATEFLERLLLTAVDRGWTRYAIEILILRTLLDQEQGLTAPAIEHLEQALALAEAEGFVQVFVDEGPQMASLLYEALSRDIAPGYVRRLLAAYPAQEQEEKEPPTGQQAQDAYWLEPLSEREIEILALIAEGGTNKEIAAKAFLSLNTIKAHTRSIYSKLGVNSRMQAVVKARALGILDQ